ncbi:unnamed protein product, partial [Nesidiocoris tenuis]
MIIDSRIHITKSLIGPTVSQNSKLVGPLSCTEKFLNLNIIIIGVRSIGSEIEILIGTSQATSSTGLWFTDDPSIEGKDGALQVDRDERLRLLKEKQNEERQRKLEELKQQ